jgi:hypothetical protein
VESSRRNLKVTTLTDLKLAELLLASDAEHAALDAAGDSDLAL